MLVMSMRRVVAGIALVGLLGAACAPAPPQQTPSTGGVAPVATAASKPFALRIGSSASTSALDPHASIGNNPRWNGLFETLVAQDETGKLIPSLSTSWKSLNPTTWQFSLAPGRKFSNGEPLTIQDVKFSYDRALNPDNKLGILTRLLTVDKTEVVDNQTFNVITKAPDPLLVKRVALVVILSKAHVEKLTPGEVALKPLGSGPYMLKEFVPNDHWTLVPNPHAPVQPFASEVTIKAVPELAARVAGLRTGDLDIITTVSMDQADSLKSAGYQIVNFNQGRSQGAFLFTTQQDQPTSNKLVRQAMNYAVDKEAMAKTIFKGYTKPEAGQVLQATTVGYNPNVKAYPYDPEKAKQLLAQAGYANGIKIKADLSAFIVESQATWLFVQSQWRAVGIDADLNFITDTGQFLDRWYGRAQRGQLLSVTLLNSPAMDADFALTWFKGSLSDSERRYNNPAFDEAYTASLTELNEQRRSELLQRAVAAMHEDPPYLFLIEGFDLWAAHGDLIDVRARGDQDPRVEIIRKKWPSPGPSLRSDHPLHACGEGSFVPVTQWGVEGDERVGFG
jgi:peptide/nickel transport system substrate-binding protein